MKILIILLILVYFPITFLAAMNVNVVLKDGSIVKGNLLGKTADELYLDAGNGKADVLKMTNVKSVFDAEKGVPLDLSASSSTTMSLTNGQVITNKDGTIVVMQVPGTEVRYIDYNGDVIYFYNGYWWRSWGNAWYRSYAYSGPWVVIEENYVPGPVVYIGPRWRFYEPHYYYHYGFRHGHRRW